MLTLFACATACSSEEKAPTPKLAEKKQAATVDLDESYVVMARQSLVVRQNAHIVSGNVGVNHDLSAWPSAGDNCIETRSNGSQDLRRCFVSHDGSALRFEQNVDASEGTKAFGNGIQLDRNVRVSAVYYKDSLSRHSSAVIEGITQQVGAAYFPLFPNLPTPKPVDAAGDATGASGVAEIKIKKDESLCLGPGSYGDIRLLERATLRFAANCATPDAPTVGTYVVRDLRMGKDAVLRVGPGDVRIRDLTTGNDSQAWFGAGTVRMRDFRASAHSKLALAPAAYHFRNFRTDANVVTRFTVPDAVVDLMVANKLRIGRNNMFNSTRVGSDLPSEVDASRVRFYVHGRDGDTGQDGSSEPPDEQVYPARPVAVQVAQSSKFHANIMALGVGAQPGGTIHIRQSCIAIGSYFGDHVIIDANVQLTNRNGLVGPNGGTPGYLDGDADNDSIDDELDNCLTAPNLDQADGDHDGAGNVCDNCPTVGNPKQEIAFPGDPTNIAGSACQVPPLPYCGDGILQTAQGEECDQGFANHGPTLACSLDCVSNLPRIVSQPVAQTVTEGDPASFFVGVQGTGLSYQWQRSGVDIEGANAATYTLPAAVYATDHNARFRAIVTNFAGSSTSSEVTLTVRPAAPVLTSQPQDVAVVEGSPATFDVVAEGSNLTYRWQRNGQNIAGATQSTYTLAVAALTHDGDLYRVVVANGAGSVTSAPATLHVTMAAPQILTQPSAQGVTEGEEASFTVAAQGSDLSYQWQKSGVDLPGQNAATLRLVAASLSDAGDYRVVVSNLAGSVTSASASLSVSLSPPTILAQPQSQTAQEGAAVDIMVVVRGSQLSYQWQENNLDLPGQTHSALHLNAVQASDDGKAYRVRVSNAAGSLTSAQAVLHVSLNAPLILTQPTDRTVDEGEQATFSVVAAGTGLSFQWQRDGVVIPGATHANYTLVNAALTDSAAGFRCLISNSAGTIASALATLTVRQLAPAISAQPAALSVREGELASFEVIAVGSQLTYQWQRNGVAIQGATQSRFELPQVTFADHGAKFRVAVTNAAGSVTSNEATLSVDLRSPVMLSEPSDQQVTEGQSVAFSAVVQGTNLSYQWQRNGVVIPGATAATYTVPTTSYADNGATFRLSASNTAGSVVSRVAHLTVRLAAPQLLAQPSDVTVDEGGNATFSVSAQGTQLSYQWQRNGVSIPGATGPSTTYLFAALANHGDQFHCVVSNSAGTVASSSATLSVRRLPPQILTQPTARSVQEGSPVSFNVAAQGSDLSYRWQRDGFDIAGATGSSYTIASSLLSDDGASFRVVITNPAGGVTSLAALLSVALAPPAITAQPASVSVRERETATFSVAVQGSLLSIQWLRDGSAIPGASAPSYVTPATELSDDGTTFQAVVTNAAGTVTSTAALLHVTLAAPLLTSQPQDQSVDEGQPATFSVTAVATAASYRWQRDGVNIPGATAATYTLAVTEVSDSGSAFRCVVSNGAGSITSQTAQLTVRLLPPAILSEPSDQTVAEGESAVFSVIARGTEAHFQWQRDAVDLPGATSDTLTLSNLALSVSGSRYRVRISNAAGSVTSREALLSINQLAPQLASHPASLTVDEGSAASFTVSAGGSGLSYQWQKDGANIPGATSAAYSYLAPFADNGVALRCVVSNAAGSVTSHAASLTVRLLPPVISTGPATLTVLEGSSASFACTATGTLVNYAWTRNGQVILGESSASYVLSSASLADDSDLFRCVVSNAAGAVTSAPATLHVQMAPPTILAQPADVQVTEGAPASFAVIAQGSHLSYQWRRDGVNLPGAIAASFAIDATSLAMDGAVFNVLVSNAAGAVTSRDARLTVALAPPVITQHPTNRTATEGQPATFSCAARGSLMTVRWQRDGEDLPGATGLSYTLPAVAASDDQHSFRCIAQNAAGSAVSANASLSVVLLPPVITAQPSDASVLEGETATFSCLASGTDAATRWQRNTVDIPNAAGSSYTTGPVSLADANARFRCIVTNPRASVVSNEARLTVLLRAPLITTEPADQSAVEGGSATFSVLATGTNLSYQWRKGATSIPGATSASYTTPSLAYSDHDATYSVLVQNSGGSITSRSARLQVSLLPPEINQDPADHVALVGDAITFQCHATGTNVSYRWQRAGVDLPDSAASSWTLSVTQADDGATYRCVASNSAGSVSSAAATLQVVACIAGRFTPQDTHCGSGACADTGRTSCNGGVIVDSCVPGTTSPATCSGSQIISCVNGQDHVTECADADACNGAESCAAGHCTSGSAPVVDDNNACTADSCDPSQGVRHVALNQGSACGSGRQCDAAGACIVVSQPAITQAPASLTANIGASATFSVGASGGNLSYQWLRLGEAIPGATAATYTRSGVRTDEHGTQFSVRVSNSVGSVTSAPATLSVVDSVGPVISLDGESARETTSDSIVLTGSIRDAGVGVASLDVRSSRYGAQLFGATITGERFSVELPLALGANALTLLARDAASNLSQVIVNVSSGAAPLPRLTITSPADGSRTDNDNVTVTGTVRSSLLPTQIRLLLGSQVTFPTGSGGLYAFSFPNVRLAAGPNLISVRAETSYGSVIAQSVVELRAAAPVATNPPPKLSVVAKSNDVYADGTAVQVSGSASDERCIASVTANGQVAILVGQGGDVTFDASVPFALQVDALDIHVVAIDCDGAQASLDYTVRRDAVAPILAVQNLTLSPASNAATLTPYPVAGTITELNLAGFSADEQSIGVLPTGEGTYTFSMDVPLVRGQTRALTLEAWDFAGNRAQVAVNLSLDAELDLQVVSPVDGAKFMVAGASQALEVVARVPGLASGDRVVAVVDGGAPLSLTVAESIARGDVSLGEGSHTVTVRVESSAGVALASKAVKVTVVDGDDVQLAMTRIDPPNGAVGIEGNAAISFALSKPVPDPTKLTVRMLETVHGESYSAATPGADMRNLSGPELIRLDRDRQLMLGALTILPGADSMMFEPEAEVAFGARVEFEVFYDGQSIGKAAYQVRPLPTLATGVVYDSSGEPVANVEVTLVEAGVSTVTDVDGAFSFGFAAPAERDLAGGFYHLLVNAKAKNPRYAAVERLVRLEPGRLTSLGATQTYLLSQRTPYRELSSGAPNQLFDDGRLAFDLSSATLRMPDGAAAGPVHVQPIRINLTSFQAPNYAIVSWLYALQPLGITLAGQPAISIQLMEIEGSYDYVAGVGERVLLIGRDPATLRLKTVGVAKVDAQNHRITSEGKVGIDRLDAIGYGIVIPQAQGMLSMYGKGEITLQDLNAALSVAP